MTVDTKPSLGSLAHFGVKGMHWGQHAMSELMPSHRQVGSIAKTTGQVVRRASVSTAKGAGKTVAYATKHKHQLAGAAVLTALLLDVGSTAVGVGKAGILFKAAKNREAARKGAEVLSRTLSSSAATVKYAKLARGAYKITTS